MPVSLHSFMSKTVINIKCAPEGAKFTVDVDNLQTTVSEFKTLLQEKSKIPAEDQRLIYKGHVLKDSRTLESYGSLVDNRAKILTLLYNFCFQLCSTITPFCWSKANVLIR